MDAKWKMYHELLRGQRTHVPARVIDHLLRHVPSDQHYDIWLSIIYHTEPSMLDIRIRNRLRVAKYKPEIVARQLEGSGFIPMHSH
tara:strand:+ start:377 stop:634 length:258 start_codon:yes stop_codon:yes gene_type:complete